MATVIGSIADLAFNNTQHLNFEGVTSISHEDASAIIERVLNRLDTKHMRGFLYIPSMFARLNSSVDGRRVVALNDKQKSKREFTAPYLLCTEIDDSSRNRNRSNPWCARYVLLSRKAEFFLLSVTWEKKEKLDEEYSRDRPVESWDEAKKIELRRKDLVDIIRDATDDRVMSFPCRILYGIKKAQEITVRELGEDHEKAIIALSALKDQDRFLENLDKKLKKPSLVGG